MRKRSSSTRGIEGRFNPATRTARASRSLVLAVGLALALTTQAQFTYTTNNGTITITGYSGAGGAVTIPNSTNGLPVTSIQGYAISDFVHTFITLTIPGSVTSIGDY